MIRTRPTAEELMNIVGSGPYVLALSMEELKLVGALVGLCKLGIGKPYREAAYQVLTNIEAVTDNQDFCFEALVDIAPVFVIHDPNTLDVIAQYDENHLIEIDV